MLNIIKGLKKRGILCINKRNGDYVLRYNSRKLYPIVDNKLKTKRLAQQAGIATPELFAVIKNEHQVKEIASFLDKHDDFVIKPAHGAGGDGILVITRKVKGRFRKVNGQLITVNDIAYHLSCTLSGAYSLGGHPDCALIEHRVQVDEVFQSISYEGVPDIRVIVFLGYPVMAMLRLPTRQSDGKANLHQGAIGVGIELNSGKTIGGVSQNSPIDFHPDTLNDIAGLTVPYWHKILDIAASSFELTGLGYLGVDIVLDKTHGPLMLELNARPGLNIQIANRYGLVHRYKIIEAHVNALKKKQNAQQRITFSLEHFKSE